MLTLYHAWGSTCSQKVRLALAEKGVDYESRLLNLRRFEQFSPEFLAVNPDAVVPVLVHDGFKVRESTIINVYVDEAFPDVPLRPRDARGRARVAEWSRFVDDVPTLAVKMPSFQRNMRPFLMALSDAELDEALAKCPNPATAARWRNAARAGIPQAELDRAHADLRRTLDRMESALASSEWLAGDMYTLADIDMVPFVHRISAFEEYEAFARWPRVAAWYARMKARPAFARAKLVEQKATRDQSG